MSRRHPNRAQLAMWLDGTAPNFDDHIDDCPICAEELASISDDDGADADIGPALLILLEPPPDLHDRVAAKIAERLQAREDAALFGALLGLGIDTARIFVDGGED